MTTSVARSSACERKQRRKLELPLGIHAPGRLVEDEEVGLGHEHRREPEPLPFAAGQVAGMPGVEAAQPDERESSDALARGRRRRPSATSSSTRSATT